VDTALLPSADASEALQGPNQSPQRPFETPDEGHGLCQAIASCCASFWEELLKEDDLRSDYTRLEDPGDVPFPKNIFLEEYELKDQLGKGSTAHCYACEERATGLQFAAKVINKRKIAVKYRNLIPQFRKEVEILRGLNHPNIIRLKDVFESSTMLHVVTELATGGELFDFLVSKPNCTLTEASASFLVRQCIGAVAYMHRHSIIHRDLKLENILIHKPVEHYKDIQLKIIDFGLSKSFTREQEDEEDDDDGKESNQRGTRIQRASTFFGTAGYIAPEMMKRKAYTKSVDVWALGVITFVLLCGVFPFDDQKRPNDMYKLRFPSWASGVSDFAKNLIGRLLEVNPETRISAEKALEHPWVTGSLASPMAVLKSPKHIRHWKASPGLPTFTNAEIWAGAPDLKVTPLVLDEKTAK